ncbi:MAG: hypothetical protein GXP14_14415 [Gammaproteobacteria bacterium]|nr:hypothetical protein [Gammaproteobacteria bacterium]
MDLVAVAIALSYVHGRDVGRLLSVVFVNLCSRTCRVCFTKENRPSELVQTSRCRAADARYYYLRFIYSRPVADGVAIFLWGG